MDRRVAWLLPALLTAAAFAALGAWQLGRARSKEQQLAAWAGARGAEPLVLADALARATPLPAPVVGRGRYRAQATLLLDNQVRDGRAGAMVYTLFEPAGATPRVLVNRGWIALDAQRRVPAGLQPPVDEREVRGLLAAAPQPGLALGDAAFVAGPTPPLLTRIDPVALRASLEPHLAAPVLLLDPADPDGYARDWRPLPNTLPPARHRGYAVQWFALALAVLVTYTVLSWRRR